MRHGGYFDNIPAAKGLAVYGGFEKQTAGKRSQSMMNDAERTLACALLSAAVALVGAHTARGAVLDVGFDEGTVLLFK